MNIPHSRGKKPFFPNRNLHHNDDDDDDDDGHHGNHHHVDQSSHSLALSSGLREGGFIGDDTNVDGVGVGEEEEVDDVDEDDDSLVIGSAETSTFPA